MAVLQDLAGRKAVVTGAARGLGRAIADRLAAAGAEITAVDLATALYDMPLRWRTAAIDLSAPEAPDMLCELARALENVDIVVANAGLVPPWRGIGELDAKEWHYVMTLNVWGVASTLGAFADALAASGNGSVITMASINGYRAQARQVLYSASKHAVIGVTRSAALELGARGIRVNALAPGPIATDALLDRIAAREAGGGPSRGAVLNAFAAQAALGRIATSQDVANAAHFLASDASAGLTGLVLPVDGGLN